MNINHEMNELGQMGTTGYSASNDVVDQLVTRTKRRRSARRSFAATVGAAGALVLGVVGAQVVTVFQDDDAGRNDRNTIERSLGGDLGDSKYSNPKKNDSDLDKIFEQLDTAAKQDTKKPGKKKSTTKTDSKKTETKTETETCTDDTSSYDWKWYDCSKDKWKVYETSYKDTYGDNEWRNCETDGGVEHPDKHVYFSCEKMKWKTYDGYFIFIDDKIYKCEKWLNHYTGETFYGNYSPSYDKVAFCNSATSTSYSYYKHLNGKAQWTAVSGETYKFKCKGTWEDDNGAPWAYNCATEDKIMTDPTNYKWFEFKWFIPGCSDKGYYNKNEAILYTKDEVTYKFEWIGGEWQQTAPADA